jgi:ferredoxin--NADP+ reductase/benzoate/toluate 1,2-dioxygenase reductase subunit
VKNIKVDEAVFVIESVRHLTPSTFVLRFSRNGLAFSAGQHLVLGLQGSSELREYSIYSGMNEPSIEVLVKEVDEGRVSRQLKNIGPGESLEVQGPYGFFLTRSAIPDPGKLLFLASGTGIAPFHSYVRSFPEADYRIILGVRTGEEAYEASHYKRDRMVVCTSRDRQGDFHGRLTDYLLEAELDTKCQVYLCGNSGMIFDAMDILLARGFSQKQLFTEVYF